MKIHPNILHNGRIREATEASLFPGQLGLLSGWGIFSTLRVANGALFAWERHWARMWRDAKLLNVAMPEDPDAVERDLLRLVEANRAPNCTLRLVIVRNTGGFWDGPASGRASDTIALTADSKQWPDSVRLGIQPHARYAASDFTRAKVLSWAHNLRWAELAQEKGFDEVILLNEFDRVAECTSANVFAVFGNEVITPPLTAGCLPGITREVLLEIAAPGIRFLERDLTLEDLYLASEVFITSTTRGLLRVREIAGRALNLSSSAGGGDVCQILLGGFNAFVQKDIGQRKSATVAV